MNSLLENIVIGLLSGIISGFYSGLVISRVIRFNDLCSEALRGINSIEYIQESNQVTVDRKVSLNVPLIAAELYHYGHKAAGSCVQVHYKQATEIISSAEHGQKNIEELEKVLTSVRSNIRKAKPSWKIFIPWVRYGHD